VTPRPQDATADIGDILENKPDVVFEIVTSMTLVQAIAHRRTQREFSQQAVSLHVVKRLLWAAYGVSEDGDKRTTPSAHALHALRLYVCAGRVERVEPGVHFVASNIQDLRLHIDHDVRAELEAAALGDQP
jgi:hypothetical protein